MAAESGDAAAPASVDAAVRGIIRHLIQGLDRGDAVAVHAIIEDLLAEGWTPGAVVHTALSGALREIGQRWQEGRWTVAQEHAATMIVGDELALLAARLPPPSSAIEVVVVCAEGEWHVLAARMAALLLREHGFRVRLIGGSVPVGELDRTLGASPPDVVAVSCTHALALAGAARIATVLRQRGIPTLGGGAGFGASPHRALRLGLTAWAASVDDGAAQILRWREAPPALGDRAGPAVDLDALEDRWRVMVDEVIDRLRATGTVALPVDQPLAPLRQDLTELLQAAHLTALCEDPTLFTDHLDRLAASPRHRGLPAAAIPSTIEILRQLVGVYEPEDVGDGALLDALIGSHAPSIAHTSPVLARSALIARTLIEVEDPDLLRRRLVGLAAELVEGCDHVGLVVLDHGEPETPAQRSWVAHTVEDLEHELGEGPCLEAIRRRDVVDVGDLAAEERWPDYGRAVLDRTGVRSVLAIPLIVRGHVIGVLEFFAEGVDAFGEHDRSVAVDFAIHAAVALHAAIQQRTLTEAIATRDLIGQAKGILMEREAIDGDRAFEMLRTVSNETNTKLRDVAASIVGLAGDGRVD
jgi:methanogenic corrinoid protein MtbC1/GAF domain-containing protein